MLHACRLPHDIAHSASQGHRVRLWKAACLGVAIPVLHNSPGQLRDGEGQRVAELQV